MKAKIIKRELVAKGTIKVEFGEFQEEFTFKPGQYMFITLPTLHYPDERGNRRHFSIVNSPNEKGILRMTTRLTESGYKKTLNELPIGTEVEVGPIAGAFLLPEDSVTPLVMIAGGIGITPFMSMLSYITEEKLPYKIKLLYSNTNKEVTAYFNELESMSNTYTDVNVIFIMTQDPNWKGENRRIDAELLKEYLSNVNSYHYLVVGPPGMVDGMLTVLDQAGVEKERIKKENFSGY